MLGLKRHTVLLAPPHESWKALYEQEEKEIERLLGTQFLDIQHIGSTSIRGIYAKPILDIGILIATAEKVALFDNRLQTLGYTYRGDAGQSGGHVFVKNTPEDLRTHHIHLIVQGDTQWEKYLLFRDYLNQHPEAAEAYSELKQKLAIQFRDNRGAYTRAKTEFVQEILNKKK